MSLEIPGWVKPGQQVTVETRHAVKGTSATRAWTVARVGKRYIIVSDSMGNEQKFLVDTMSRTRPNQPGWIDVLVPYQPPLGQGL